MKKFWSGLFWFNWLVILFFWWQGSGAELLQSPALFIIGLGRLAGLAAAYYVLTQFFLMGRLPWLERAYGLDRLSRIHQRQGRQTLVFLLLHPVLLVIGYSLLTGFSLWRQFLSFYTGLEYVQLAVISLLLFVAVVVSSLVIIRTRLRYESWYFVHLLVYAAAALGVWHQFENGSTILHSRFFYGYWLTLYLLVLANHLVFRFGRPVFNYFRYRFTVSEVKRENYNTVSVYISGRSLSRFPVRPGQFMIVRFLTKGLWWQAHPFSMSMLPDGQRLRVSIKELGDFTGQVQFLLAGTKVVIDGPYGIFTDFLGISSKVLMIAGGIGITPIRSLAEEFLSKGRDVVLLYANRTQRDIVFEEELEALRQQYPARIIHILAEEPNYSGERGRLDEEKLRRLVPDLQEREIYLCGPVPMMDSLLAIFKKLKLDTARIHYEKFSLV